MQETMAEFKEYFEEEIDDGTKDAYNKALEKLEKLTPYEEALVSTLISQIFVGGCDMKNKNSMLN